MDAPVFFLPSSPAASVWDILFCWRHSQTLTLEEGQEGNLTESVQLWFFRNNSVHQIIILFGCLHFLAAENINVALGYIDTVVECGFFCTIAFILYVLFILILLV